MLLSFIERRILELLIDESRGDQEISKLLDIPIKMIIKIKNNLIMNEILIVSQNGTHSVNKLIYDKLEKEDEAKEIIDEIIESTKEGCGHFNFKIKSVRMDKFEQAIYRDMVNKLQNFVGSIEKKRSGNLENVTFFWGDGLLDQSLIRMTKRSVGLIRGK